MFDGLLLFLTCVRCGGATRGPLHPLRGCPRAWALEWERWISLRWLFGDSNAVVSLRWGLGGLRHFRGALRPFRHSSRGLPTGSAIRCHSSLSCAGAHYSGFVGRASSMWLLGEYGIFLFCSPRFWVVGVFFARAFLLGRLVYFIKGVRESTLSVGKSRARNPTQNPTQKPTPNRPEPGRTIQRLRTAPCPQALRSARDAWRAHGPSSEETAHTPRIPRPRQGPQARSGTESYAWSYVQ